MIIVHDPKFVGTNIEAYLLPNKKAKDFDIFEDFEKDFKNWQDSKITISVTPELSTYIRTVTNYENETSKIVDISHIMDRIEVSEEVITGNPCDCIRYYAKLKQVDTVEDNEWISVDEQKPFNAGLYLCHTNDEQTMVCFLSTNGWWSKVPDASFYGDMGNKIVINSKEVEREVTHWKPLPKAPTNKSIND